MSVAPAFIVGLEDARHARNHPATVVASKSVTLVEGLVEECSSRIASTGIGTTQILKTDGSIGILSYLRHGFVHEIAIVGILVIKRGLGCRSVSQTIVGAIRVGVGSTIAVRGGIVGMEDGTTLMIGSIVYHIAAPCVFVIVYMQYEQSLAWERCVPTRLLSVLQQVVFTLDAVVATRVVVQHVCLAIIGKRLHISHVDSLNIQFGRSKPSSPPLLITGIARRTIATTIVAAIVHEVP